ncbi:exported hypothetical protein [Tenacibaculum litopenaei]|uniref:invasin domain 3-containing protein n=1 Tax=Tenacibaculum litopenaei TaxID=396016 RepID=UPI0038942A88
MKNLLRALITLLVCTINLPAQNKTLGTGTGTSSYTPIGISNKYNYSQFIYFGAEINHSGPITSLTFKLSKSGNLDIENFKNWTVKVKMIAATQFTQAASWPYNATTIDGMTTVYKGPITYDEATGYIRIPFTQNFDFVSTNNLVVEVLENTAGSGSWSAPKFLSYATTHTRALYKYVSFGSSTIDPTSFTSVSNTEKKVPQVVIGFQPSYSTTPADANKSDISIDKAAVVANGTEKATIRVTLKDALGNPLSKSGGVLTFSSPAVTTITDNADGTYSAQFSTSQAGNYALTATVTQPGKPAVVLTKTISITALPNTETTVKDSNCGNGTTRDVPANYEENFSGTKNNSWSMTLYKKEEISTSSINITHIGYYTCTTGTINPANKQRIFMKEVTDTSITNAAHPDLSEFTEVYSGSITWSSGTKAQTTIALNTPFTLSGTKNLLVYFLNEHGDNIINSGFTKTPSFVRSNTPASEKRLVYKKFTVGTDQSTTTGTLSNSFPSTYFKLAPLKQTNTFNATLTNNWGDAGNWSTGKIPSSQDNVIVAQNATINVNSSVKDLTITAGAVVTIPSTNNLSIQGNLTNNGSLTIDSNSSHSGSLIVLGTSTGNVKYQRYITTDPASDKGWHLLSSPVKGQLISDFKDELLTKATKYAFAQYKNNRAAATRWEYLTTTTINGQELVPLEGYSVKVKAATKLSLTGTLHADLTKVLTDGSAHSGNRWNLIGNPYTAALQVTNSTDPNKNFLKVNIQAASLDPLRSGIFVWNGSRYQEKSVDDAAFYLAPGQAFFVHAKDGGASQVVFNRTMLTHQNNLSLMRTASNALTEIQLSIDDTNSRNTTKVRYIHGKTTGLDIGSDIATFTATQQKIGIYTQLVSGEYTEDFAIQALPNSDYETMVVPIGTYIHNNNTRVSIGVQLNKFPQDITCYLEDKKTGEIEKLSDGKQLVKNLSSADNGTGRFYLHTKSSKVLSTTEVPVREVLTYYSNGQLVLKGFEGNCQITLFTTAGASVFNEKIIGSGDDSLPLPQLTPGIYLCKVHSNSRNITKKIQIN